MRKPYIYQYSSISLELPSGLDIIIIFGHKKKKISQFTKQNKTELKATRKHDGTKTKKCQKKRRKLQ